ncbi:hypothetical protein HOC01_01790 [archaeon]|jgi:hypothetical protein|nr:hypothetical protein [archaeon]MBT6697948.1 hypothetical protein [archaeon]
MPRKSSKSSKKSTSSSSKRSKTKSTSKKRKSKLFNKSDPLLLKLLKLLWHCFKWTMVKIGQLVAWVTKSLHKKAKQSHKTHKKNKQIKKQKEHLKAIQPQSPPQKIPLEEVEVLEGNLKKFESWFYKKKSTIGIILGARGSGKSALGMFLLENFKAKTKKQTYAMGFQEESLPEYIKSVSHIDEIKNDSVILIDEGGIEFSSRNAMTNANKLLSEILLIARHKDLCVIFITQNSSNLEINAIRQADYLLLKPSSLLQKDFERKKIKDIYEEVQEDYKIHKDTTGVLYIYADKFRGFATNTLPTFWSDNVSKGYAKRDYSKE